MSTTPPPDESGAGRHIEEAMERIEAEVRRAIEYFNEEVVPQIRSESVVAMRRAADKLRQLADRIEQPKGPRG
jgi:bisphosphoglycerate-dependent phosphoglycerate mutase